MKDPRPLTVEDQLRLLSVLETGVELMESFVRVTSQPAQDDPRRVNDFLHQLAREIHLAAVDHPVRDNPVTDDVLELILDGITQDA